MLAVNKSVRSVASTNRYLQCQYVTECLHNVAGYTDYSAAFYTYDVLLLISAITVAVMPLGAKLPADNLLRDLINIIKMPHIIVFIFFLFALGNFWGFIESYLFIYLKELGAPNFLLGKHLNKIFHFSFNNAFAFLNLFELCH